MYLAIIFSIITLILLWLIWKDSNTGSVDEEFVGSAILTIFIMVVLYGIVIGFARSHYVNKHNLNSYEYYDLPIVSLTNDEEWNMNGAFILGIGGVHGGSDTHYVTYGKFKQGFKKLELSDTYYYLRESDLGEPRILNYWVKEIRKPFKSKWLWDREYEKGEIRENIDANTIIVPKNTIYKEFKVQY